MLHLPRGWRQGCRTTWTTSHNSVPWTWYMKVIMKFCVELSWLAWHAGCYEDREFPRRRPSWPASYGVWSTRVYCERRNSQIFSRQFGRRIWKGKAYLMKFSRSSSGTIGLALRDSVSNRQVKKAVSAAMTKDLAAKCFGGNPFSTRHPFKEWLRWRYPHPVPAIYVFSVKHGKLC